MGWLHGSGAWLALTTCYTLVVAWNLNFQPRNVLPRVMFAGSTYWCTWLSDWLHNLDLKMGVKANVHTEFIYYRMDLLSISAILNAQLLLWVSNLAWAVGRLQVAAMCTATSFNAALLFWPGGLFRKHRRVLALVTKLVYGLQFLLCGWVAYVLVYHTKCSFATTIWFVYLPGFLAFTAKPLVDHKFEHVGPHEVFHAFVWMGHVVTMAIDGLFSSPWCGECPAGRIEVS